MYTRSHFTLTIIALLVLTFGGAIAAVRVRLAFDPYNDMLHIAHRAANDAVWAMRARR